MIEIKQEKPPEFQDVLFWDGDRYHVGYAYRDILDEPYYAGINEPGWQLWIYEDSYNHEILYPTHWDNLPEKP